MSCCDITQEFPCKLQREERILNFNFQGALLDDTITAIRPVIVEMLVGVDESPDDIIKGPPGVAEDGVTVQFPVDDGVKGGTYLFTVEVERGNNVPAMMQAFMAVV